MQKKPLYFLLGIAMATLLAYGCKRVNGINNNQVIKTPYALFYSDSAGALFKTNDGKTVTRLFPPDGKPCRALCVSGPNIIMVKNRLYVSSNNGANFNIGYDSVLQDWNIDTSDFCLKHYGHLNQSMIIDVPAWNTVYVTCRGDLNPVLGLGVAFSLNQHGVRGSWNALALADTNFQGIGVTPVNLTSFTLMKNGTLVGYDVRLSRFFFAWAKQYDFAGWRESSGSATGLPSLTPLPGTDSFTIGHLNNRLIAAPLGCSGTVYYSDDTGRNWTSYGTGLNNAPALCVASPFDQIALIGTDGKGLFILNTLTGVWQQNSNGLPGNLVVRNIAAKEQTFKNGVTEQYIYLATNQGIFQSRDKGFNWILTIPGNYNTVY
jgi:hypothetical protein